VDRLAAAGGGPDAEPEVAVAEAVAVTRIVPATDAWASSRRMNGKYA